MSTLRDIRRRIRSVEKTQKITSAMRMVAAAKLRRAQDAIIAARPYAERMRETLEEQLTTTLPEGRARLHREAQHDLALHLVDVLAPGAGGADVGKPEFPLGQVNPLRYGNHGDRVARPWRKTVEIWRQIRTVTQCIRNVDQNPEEAAWFLTWTT